MRGRCWWVDPSGDKPSGAIELLRRLPVIAIEDGLPPPLMPPLVWLMAAHTNTKAPMPLSAAHVNLVLAAVLQIAAGGWREQASAAASEAQAQARAAAAAATADTGSVTSSTAEITLAEAISQDTARRQARADRALFGDAEDDDHGNGAAAGGLVIAEMASPT